MPFAKHVQKVQPANKTKGRYGSRGRPMLLKGPLAVGGESLAGWHRRALRTHSQGPRPLQGLPQSWEEEEVGLIKAGCLQSP